MGGQPRIVLVGGGSNQWTPKLVVDFLNTPSLADAHIVLEDIDGANLPRMQRFVEHCAEVRGTAMTASTTTDQRDALAGADFVVVSISTGGFASMRADLDVPAARGVVQTVGDTVGPGGICRALRNVPVLAGLGRDMAECCPDAWMLNLTNPMTVLTHAAAGTGVKVAGVCHEVTIATFFLSVLLDCPARDLDVRVAGVNHLPFVTALTIAGADGTERLAALAAGDVDRQRPLGFDLPGGLGMPPRAGGPWTVGELWDMNRVKFDVFRRLGALPAAGDRHVVEFFDGYCTDEMSLRRDWGVHLTSIDERIGYERGFSAALDELLAAPEVSTLPSGETIARVMDSLLTGRERRFALNLPNGDQLAWLPADAVVETTCAVGAGGMQGEPAGSLPAEVQRIVGRIVESQELTAEAAATGDRATLVAALEADPLTSRLPRPEIALLAADLVEATRPWLPSFA
jgi:alpha-galactosidase